MGFNVTANEINKFANYLYDQVDEDIRVTHRGVREHAVSVEGLGGVLEPELTTFMEGTLGNLFTDEVAFPLQERVRNMAETLKAACRAYGAIDEEAEADFQREHRTGPTSPAGW